MNGPTIGQLAKRAGVGVETVRFYERKGLIEQPRKRTSGYRVYPDDVVQRIQFIRHAKDLGFTLAEIGELLSLRPDPRTNCAAVKDRAQAKMAAIDEKVATTVASARGSGVTLKVASAMTASVPIAPM